MSRPSVTKTVGGFEVSTTKLAPTEALKLAPKLIKLVIQARQQVEVLAIAGELTEAERAHVAAQEAAH